VVHTLTRMLGFRDLTLLVIGCVIGSGIFLVPGLVIQQTGGYVGVALSVWLIAGLLSLLGALTCGELAAMDPKAGGLYVYIRDAFGPLPAFLYGWTLFFVLSNGAIATLAVAFTAYLDQLVPMGTVSAKLASVAMIVAIAAVNIRGTRKSAGMQNWTTGFKIAALLLMAAGLMATGPHLGQMGRLWPDSFDLAMLSAAGVAMIAVLWAYEGWQNVTFSAGEAVRPQTTFPRAIGVGTAALIVIYMMANIGYVAALGPEGAAASSSIAADATGAMMGPIAAKLVAMAILVSMFSAANGFTLTSTRVYFAMAQDGLFFRRLGEIHPRFGTPAIAVAASGVWTIVLATTGTFEQLLTYVVFVGWIFYALGASSIFFYRRRRADVPRPFKVPGYPLTPVLFLVAAAAIVLNTIATQPERAAVGAAMVLTGIPAYFFWSRARSVAPQSASLSGGV
jgi:basic amino acid/polyamine antiporter, APA family